MKRIIATAVAAIALLGATAFTADTARAGVPSNYNDLFDSHPIPANGDYEPLLFGCRVDEGSAYMLWYAAGPAADHLWTFEPSESELIYTSDPMPVNGVYDPVVGDFDGDGCDDILWYAAGTAPDFVWWGSKSLEGIESQAVTINGDYEPVAGRFSEEARDSIFWYAPGPGADYVWTTAGDRNFTSKTTPAVNGTYRVATAQGAVLFHTPGPGTDYLWFGLDPATGTVAESGSTQINGTYEPSPGYFGFLLYAPGTAPDYLLYSFDEEGTPQTLPATINGTYETGERAPAFNQVHIWHAPGTAPDYLWTPSTMRATDLSQVPSEPGEFRRG